MLAQGGMTPMEAIRAATLRPVDLVIIDLGLPDMDGKAIIRHSSGKSDTPIIVISAQHSASEVEAAHQAGACCFMHKPFGTPELVRRVEASIAGSKSAG